MFERPLHTVLQALRLKGLCAEVRQVSLRHA